MKKIADISHDEHEELSKAIAAMQTAGVCLKGHILARTERVDKLSLQMHLNRKIKAFAHVTKIKSFEGVPTKHDGIDFVIVRETTEGEYCGEEHEVVPGVVESLKVTTKKKSEDIARFAFQYAIKHGRKRVTCVHKANIMKQGDGMFMRCFKEVAKEFPQVESNDMIVDNACMQTVSNPWQFDVMVMPNLYGNILENLGAGLVGGAGLVPSKHYSSDVVKFGPGARSTHRSAVGQNISNPTAWFLSFANLLEHKGEPDCANRIREANLAVIKEGNVLTKDLGGTATTQEFTDAVIAKL